ncbi:type I-C CRISPR-associated protein Cas8c/Csd1 [Methylocaldum sp.]|uniref:type I-C CRISPR-associated protein Cas8c/Csd1 n=1 Tax=Methylocaldum sp. TaxID=1969727 RepID=UPI002D4B847B|nr:type I-C CRISPR-associated protein Cas8c/Csd1 [Methylocaldum sp.]HYE36740.1 type I-C CRISPR-associated protein Cas8c/Csd1 [Methylocaldum sp.]
MILQALHDYYHRKQLSDDPKDRLPAFGLEEKEIPFVIEIDGEGRFVNLSDTRSGEGKKKTGQRFLVPQGVKKTSGVAANLLWDNAEYVLGIDTRGKLERVAQQRVAFRNRLDELPEQVRADPGLRAVRAFLDRLDMTPLESHPAWNDVLATNPLMSFRLHGDIELVCQRPAVATATTSTATDETAPTGTCLVTGETSPIERLHPAIKGVWGAQTAGANIVSFNCRAFESYGKIERQGENAPVGKPAVFAYTTALNHLLARDSRQRVQVGDASTVFWAEQPHDLETMAADLFGEPPKDEPDRGVDALKALYSSVESGKFTVGDADARFHVLGLAPNAARISIRFWETAPAYELARRLKRHFDDLKIARAPNDPEHLSLFRLLASIAVQGKADNIPPNLGGDFIRAILEDLPYPVTLLNSAVQRCRAEHKVTYPRAAALKAWLNRDIRRINRNTSEPEKEFEPMLDTGNPSPAYRLGRLFAALEKIQEEASPGLNATVRDRYYGAASSTPVAVFTTLLRLKNHHLGKLPRGRAVQMEKLIGEIIEGLADFPRILALPEQGRFALGYYHQRQSFFTKHEDQPGEK